MAVKVVSREFMTICPAMPKVLAAAVTALVTVSMVAMIYLAVISVIIQHGL